MENSSITIIISVFGLICSVIALVISYRNNKFNQKIELERRKEEKEKKYKELIKNRPQFKIINYIENFNKPGYKKDETYDFDVLFLPYKSLNCDMTNYSELYKKNGVEEFNFNKVGRRKTPKKPICIYEDIYDKKDEWVNVTFELKYLGNIGLQFYYLLNGMEKMGSLINIKTDEWYKTLTACKTCEHIVIPEINNVNKGDKIKIRINYHKNYIAAKNISTSYLLNMETEDGEFWQQGLFLGSREQNQSHTISPREFTAYYQGAYLDAVMFDRIYWDTINKKRRGE